MSTASLSLLKKGKKDALSKELAKAEISVPDPEPAPVPQTAVDGETITVDVEKMSEAELDEFIAAQGIETPSEWSTFDHGQKLSWMQETFGQPEQDPDAGASEAPGAPAEPVADADKPQPGETPKDPLEAGATDPGDSGPKAKGASKAKKKATAVTAEVISKEGEIVEPDVLQDLVHEIETLKEQEALALVGTLTEDTELTFFRLGGVLSLVLANHWYAPYANFREWVEKVHGLHYRKATYWIEIYNRLSNSGVPWSKVSKIGWTKLKEIAKVLTKENVDEWVNVAEEQTTLNLIETVKLHLAKEANKQLTDETEAKIVTTMTFKCHEDQKATIEAALAKAKETSGTAVSTVALELMSAEYLNTISDEDRVKAWGLDKVLSLVEKCFPTANLTLEMGDQEAAAA